MTINDINALSDQAFVSTFGTLYEHSPWVVEEAVGQRPFKDIQHMLTAFDNLVTGAGEDRQLALLRAHPELAGKAMIDRTLTDASAAEQASAGLDRMTPTEYEQFHVLNSAYRERFGFPFIICVRLTDKAGILSAMETRVKNDRERELSTALTEVSKIVRLRLEDMIS